MSTINRGVDSPIPTQWTGELSYPLSMNFGIFNEVLSEGIWNWLSNQEQLSWNKVFTCRQYER
jgi:hypothetical protein